MVTLNRIMSGIPLSGKLREINGNSFDGIIGYTSDEIEFLKDEGIVEFYEAKDGNDTVGFTAVVSGNPGNYLLLLAVDSQMRGHGYGSSILEEVHRIYGNPILLDCEPSLVPFYERNGYSHPGYAMLYKGVRYEMMFLGDPCLEDFSDVMEKLGRYETDPTYLISPDGSVTELRAYH